MMKFIRDNVEYPEFEKEAGIQGKVTVGFVVEKDGSVTNVEVAKGPKGGKNLNKEALRVVKMMPNWAPGKQSGRAVRVKFYLPVKFSLL